MLPAVPRETFTHTSFASAPIDEVWAALDRVETWEAIGGVDRVLDPVIEDGQLKGFSFETITLGTTYLGQARPDRREEGRLMSWSIDNSEIEGKMAVALAATDERTRVTVTVDIESRGLVSSVLFPVIAGALGRGLPRAVDEFARSWAG
jgi:carbon monoxide dehydrogenase subunit G